MGTEEDCSMGGDYFDVSDRHDPLLVFFVWRIGEKLEAGAPSAEGLTILPVGRQASSLIEA